jgi:OFA family oxalate/formate antiporter-like MFS transporter
MAVATIAGRMLGAGFTVLQVFNWLAISGGSLIIISGIIIKSAPESENPTSRTGRLKLSLLIKDPRIWSLFLAMFAGTFTGLTVIGNLKPIALLAGFSGSVATYSVAVFAAGNAGGRILWGWLIDIFGKKTIPADLLLLALAAWGVAASQTAVLFFSSTFLVGLCFGASFVIYATYISETYGADKTAEIYPLVFLSQGLSGIAGPASGGISYDLTGSYSYALIIAIAMTGTAGLLFLLRCSKGKTAG